MHSQPVSLKSIIISSSHLLLGLPSGLFPSVFAPKSCTYFFSPPHVFHALPISPSFFSMSSNIWQLQITKCLIMQFSPAFHYSSLLKSKYHPQNSILKHLQAHSLPWMLQATYHTIQKNRQNYSSVYILGSRCHQHISFLHITSTFTWSNPVTLKMEAVCSSKMMNIWPQYRIEIQETQ